MMSYRADIWSFDITALELAHGHAPFSNYRPMKVLLMTLQNGPPGLDYERDKKFSKSFKGIVAACLVKDPKKRPTAEKLLKHHFFKRGRCRDYVVQTILDGLPPLGDHFRMLKEADLLAQNKAMSGAKEQLSQLQDDDITSCIENQDLMSKQKGGFDNLAAQEERKLIESPNNSDSELSSISMKNGRDNLWSIADSQASFPDQSFRALEAYLSRHMEGDNRQNMSQDAGFPCKGQFVREPDCSPKDNPNGIVSACPGQSLNPISVTTASILPSLQYLLQQNAMQRDQIMRFTRYVQQITGNCTLFVEPVSNNEHIQMLAASGRDRLLESHVMSMEQHHERLVKELQMQKMENAKLEKQIKALMDKKQ